jgi:hypothetical protein
MKRVLAIAVVAVFGAWIAVAQTPDDPPARAMQKMQEAMQMKMQAIGAVKGFTVKGAPYSGEEVNETNQTLADGTRIHRETSAMVYRDSEGRTRREMPDTIIINDPVASVTYILNPKTMTGQKLTMAMPGVFYMRKDNIAMSAPAHGTATFTMKMESDGGSPTITVNGETLDPQQVQEMIAKAKAAGDHAITMDTFAMETHVEASGKATASAGAMPRTMMKKLAAGESLGKQTIEGVNAEGTRNVNTIKAGTIGNDRDIQVTSESWYSPDLQMTIMSKHSDPRTGEESFRLMNINRNEPAPYLFQVPSGYTISSNDKK